MEHMICRAGPEVGPPFDHLCTTCGEENPMGECPGPWTPPPDALALLRREREMNSGLSQVYMDHATLNAAIDEIIALRTTVAAMRRNPA